MTNLNTVFNLNVNPTQVNNNIIANDGGNYSHAIHQIFDEFKDKSTNLLDVKQYTEVLKSSEVDKHC